MVSQTEDADRQEREFVTLLLAPPGPGQPPIDVSQLIIANGWAKVRDGVGEGEEAVRYVHAILDQA